MSLSDYLLLCSGADIPSRIAVPRECWRRLQRDLRLQRAIERLHALGPRPVGELLVELLDEHGIGAAALDRLLAWSILDPALVAAVGGRCFRAAPLVLAPRC